jgi:hypothetical protein
MLSPSSFSIFLLVNPILFASNKYLLLLSDSIFVFVIYQIFKILKKIFKKKKITSLIS